jgi:hypothetical protein
MAGALAEAGAPVIDEERSDVVVSNHWMQIDDQVLSHSRLVLAAIAPVSGLRDGR